MTRGFHSKGYTYVPKKLLVDAAGLVQPYSSKGEGYVGWNAWPSQPAKVTWVATVPPT